MRYCCVPFCDVKNKSKPNRPMFYMPKDKNMFALWSDALPKVRNLKSLDRVCYLHFKPDDVLYTFDHCINGEMIKIKRDRVRLKPHAIPCMEINTQEELWMCPNFRLSQPEKSLITYQSKNFKTSANTEQVFKLNLKDSPHSSQPEDAYIEITEDQEEICINIVKMQNNESDAGLKTENGANKTEELPLEEINNDCYEIAFLSNEDLAMRNLKDRFNFLHENVNQMLLPDTLWAMHCCPRRSLICFSYMDVNKVEVTKLVVIKENGSVELYFDGQNIKTLQLLPDIDGLSSLSKLLYKMHIGQLCLGKPTNSNCEAIVEPNDDNSFQGDESGKEVYLCKFCLPKYKVLD